jgi:D-alanyl-lipoteichoic acid acyltransferase DltB (MBOAT superfamily)
MLFPTIEFAVFFLLVFLLSWLSRRAHSLHKLILCTASYIFYGYWNWRFSLLLFECSMVNYILAIWLESSVTQKGRKSILIMGVAFNLALLAYFKYWGFFLSSASDLLHALGFSRDFKIMEVLLPVGISFFTFQGLSYLVDVYRREIKACTNPLDILLYISFFPQLVAGPIVRASEFLPQLGREVDAQNIRATKAFILIGLGLFKKVVIAHYLAAELVGPVFDSPQDYGTLDVMLGVYGYAVQIYCDFSAYSDMAIGFALLLGYEFPRNFNQPYRAAALRDFWHRWHISLSSFLRDYLYIPLGGSRGGGLKTYRNLFLTMLLGGLWHGAAWNFVFWGVLHGGFLGIERFASGLFKLDKDYPYGRIFGTLLVFHFVCLTWIFFNAESFSVAWDYLCALGNTHLKVKLTDSFIVSILLIGIIGQFLPENLVDRIESGAGRMPLFAQAAALAAVIVVIGAIGPGTMAPFIYFRF